ncbi:PTS system trehalose-specific EIIBC component [Salinicoccus sp. ID82-1]|uniref:PTS trehalose transporter subunit IIBC n=1 Tax=Salinicoccus cyprini TaxID=2493691 RepID=A0A558AUQ4_9STAP|nr:MULTISPECIES: PTS system trehalose-specific EIIBC component [Salinicoccus]MCG1010621.1 PTS system trehalose-specific EIIBC component [Salinicoccus sp. ID82-1]TVT28014.1 PTS trehalose transporter subunit IIBC [Salinicoccus cyprini]
MAVNRDDVRAIIEAVGGKENINAATHCVTRLRLALEDDSKVDKEKLDAIDLVKGSFAANNQFQVVIGQGTVNDAFKIFEEETGKGGGTKDEVKAAAAQKMNPLQRFIKMLGDIFIPILPAIVTAGLLLGINNLLTVQGLFWENDSIITRFPGIEGIASMINFIAVAPFIFLPVLIGWSAMKVFGGNPLLGIALGLALCHPDLASQYGLFDAEAGELAEIPTWNFFGLQIEQLNYQGQVLPVLVATWLLAKVEHFLNQRVHDMFKLLLVAPIALLVVGILTYTLIGPVTLFLSTIISDSIVWLFETVGVLGGAVYGLFYAPLVVTGLHHMFLAVDLQLIGTTGSTYLWPILAISNIAQGSAAFGAWVIYRQQKKKKEEGLAMTSGISGWLGVTEPAMFGVNLPLKYPFIAAVITTAIVGGIFGINGLTAASVGVGGVPGVISITEGFWLLFTIGMLIAIIVPFVLTLIFSRFVKEKTKDMVKE